jgi:hypothetical protein
VLLLRLYFKVGSSNFTLKRALQECLNADVEQAGTGGRMVGIALDHLPALLLGVLAAKPASMSSGREPFFMGSSKIIPGPAARCGSHKTASRRK